MPELVTIIRLVNQGLIKEAYRDLQHIIDNPNLDAQLKAELCNISAFLSVRILNSGV